MFDAVEVVAHARSAQRRAAVRRVDVHPEIVFPRDLGDTAQIVDATGVRGARAGNHREHRIGVAVGLERAA